MRQGFSELQVDEKSSYGGKGLYIYNVLPIIHVKKKFSVSQFSSPPSQRAFFDVIIYYYNTYYGWKE